MPTDKKVRRDSRLSQRLDESAHLVLGGTADAPGSWKKMIHLGLDKGGCKAYLEGLGELLRLVRNKVCNKKKKREHCAMHHFCFENVVSVYL